MPERPRRFLWVHPLESVALWEHLKATAQEWLAAQS